MSLILIGYWRSEREPHWPDPRDLVDASWDLEDRYMVVDHLASGTPTRLSLGSSTCRFCGASNGSGELADGTYIWPEGLLHYVYKHEVRLPSDFVDHVRRSFEGTRANPTRVDESWWRGVASEYP